MNEIKMISYTSKKIVTDVIRKADLATTQANIIGTIACGAPVLAEENIEEYISLPSAIFGKGDLYILNASGDSMIEAGIEDGDLVVIKKQTTAEDGDIVVALVNNENTLKRFYIDKRNKKYILHPENSKLKDIIVTEVQIQGVAQHVIKAL
ncbi:MAG: repressor LexA [Clostridia bacterium]|nr:repressor LexA [Clostridia bacterium]